MIFPSITHIFKIKKSNIKWVIGSTIIISAFTGVAMCSENVNGLPQYKMPKLKFYHQSPLHTYDFNSVRRGFQVFKQVCSACHHIQTFSFRHLVGATHTLEEAKEMAKEYTVTDGPNEKGEMFERPMKIIDYWKNPYANNEEAMAANNGALPPDFTFLVNAHPMQEAYIVHLLNNYSEEPPAGVEVPEGAYYNMYARSQLIAMPPPLYDGQIEYDDGTPATTTQMSKDVAVFMRWVFDPHQEERKRIGLKAVVIVLLMMPFATFLSRNTHNLWRYRKVMYQKINWK